jgi:YbgC/YbaW family acyl-CoA thioester hydrolase
VTTAAIPPPGPDTPGVDDDVPGLDWVSASLEDREGRPAIRLRERVRLADTDSSGLIYYGAVTPWLSRALSELFLGLGFRPGGDGPRPMMPVVNANVTYHSPLRLADPYELWGWVEEAGTTSARIAYEVRCRGRLCVSATTTHVHLDEASHRPVALPSELVEAARASR